MTIGEAFLLGLASQVLYSWVNSSFGNVICKLQMILFPAFHLFYNIKTMSVRIETSLTDQTSFPASVMICSTLTQMELANVTLFTSFIAG